jgi:ADP-ribose pyrophosphatase YjhB (NUDIX family)
MTNKHPAELTITVNIAIFHMTPNGLEVLLIQRSNQIYQGQWILPGGKLTAADLTLEAAILREMREETGIELPYHRLRQVHTFRASDLDPREHSISVLYTLTELLAEGTQVREGGNASAVGWFTPNTDCPALALDHRTMIAKAIQHLHDWRRLTSPGTQRLSESRQCEIGSEFGERCPLPAQWEVNGWAMCDEDIQMLAAMNSDNEALVRPARAAIHPQESEVPQ